MHFTLRSSQIVSVYYIAFLLVFPSCSDKSKNDEVILKSLTDNLEKSNITINICTSAFLKELDNKTTDPCSRERAILWMPKATKVSQLTSKLYNLLLELKKNKVMDEGKINDLYNQINRYKAEIFHIDSSIRDQFADNIVFTSNEFDSLKSDETVFKKMFFNDVSDIENKATLTRFQNNIKIIENKIAGYCNSKVGCNIMIFDSYSAIVGQNSTILKPGEKLEITAGVGRYSRQANPKITFNGKSVELNEEGYSLYKINVSKVPGSYKIPVKISFVNQITGKPMWQEMNIKYTVAKECN